MNQIRHTAAHLQALKDTAHAAALLAYMQNIKSTSLTIGEMLKFSTQNNISLPNVERAYNQISKSNHSI